MRAAGQAAECQRGSLPTTRYQGSKLKIIDWVWSEISGLGFDSMLDAMGGTGIVSYKSKQNCKRVTYNDMMRFNFYAGKALIENDRTILSNSDVDFLVHRHADVKYDNFIENTFRGVFYTDAENAWIDTFIGNLGTFEDGHKIALALTCLFQACIIKRPYNLFHRKNLYMRLADVSRTFGNKATWDRDFDSWFGRFAIQYNSCVFSNGRANAAINCDVMEIPDAGSYDLVYLDPPYTSLKNTIDYMEYYHFLEGLCMYLEHGPQRWGNLIDWRRKPLPIRHARSPWNDRARLHNTFERIISKFRDSTMVVSWNSGGYPPPGVLVSILKKYHKKVETRSIEYQYALSPKKSREVLLIAS